MYLVSLFPEYEREKRKAEKKGNLGEVAKIANYLGELYARSGMIITFLSSLLVNYMSS